MYRFHITGYTGFYWEDSQRTDTQVDIKVFAETTREALEKASIVIGNPVSTSERRITIEEILGA